MRGTDTLLNGEGGIVITDNGDGTVDVAGIQAGDEIFYTTAMPHDMVLVENGGDSEVVPGNRTGS